MCTLKQSPEDFIVDEVMDVRTDGGNMAIVKVKKRETTTFKVVDLLAKSLGRSTNDIGYAGVKDRNAITTQYMSIRGAGRKQVDRLSFDKIDVEYLGQADKPIRRGMHKGNRFTITVRELDHAMRSLEVFPNYFDSQRFSENNIGIGRSIIKGDFQKAVDLVLSYEGRSHIERKIEAHLAKHQNDFIGALRRLQRGVVTLYVGAYQSYLFNRMLADRVREAPHVVVREQFGELLFPECTSETTEEGLPLIGFTTEETEQVRQVCEVEGITTRSFIVRSLPDASAAGGMRDAWCRLDDLDLSDFADGVQTASFFLQKGAYATMAIRAMCVGNHQQK